MLFADRIGTRLAIGWTMGTLVSALGCYCSVFFDTPTGATIVCTFGAVLVVMAVVKAVFFKVRQEQTQPAQVRARQVV
jgi:zinc/manganese transport system permease protein